MINEQRNVNRKLWDEWAVIHERSDFYDVETFKEGRDTLSAHEPGELGDVAGKSLLHLMCHIGLDTMSLSRLGAMATGVDFSSRSVEIAKTLAREVGIPTRFIEADVYEILEHLKGERFDVVYTSHGVLAWLSDLAGWAHVIAGSLKPGGVFYISEIHPFSQVFGDKAMPPTAMHPYFFTGANEWGTEGTYADRSAHVDTATNFQWQHTLSDVVNALIDAGLTIEFVHEHPFAVFQQFPGMLRNDDGTWTLPGTDLPFLFSLRAHLPLG